MTEGTDGLNARRRRAVWRANHRGMKELDIVLGTYADRHVATMTEAELSEFEAVLQVPEPALFASLIGQGPLPDDVPSRLMDALRAAAKVE